MSYRTGTTINIGTGNNNIPVMQMGVGAAERRGIEAAGIITGGPGSVDATRYLDEALAFAQQLADGAANINPPEIAITAPNLPDQPSLLSVTPPSLEDVTFSLPDLPPTFSGSVDVDGLLPEPFDQSPPDLVLGAIPTAQFGTAPEAPGVTFDFEDPQLNLELPSRPELLNINVRRFDGVTIPDLPVDDTPTFDLVAPSIREYVPGAEYTSSLLTALRDELQSRIVDGGTGLNPDVENAIWDRGREREARAMQDSILQLERMEEMGFDLPPGVYLDARLRINTENAATNMGLSREIMIKQAELELEAVQQALTIAQRLEADAIQYANQIEQRAFDSARYATEAGVTIYNARVQAFGEFVNVYRAKLQAYEQQIRGELAKVEVYKAEVEAEQAKSQINRTRVEEFRVLTDAALSAVRVYEAEIGAIQTKAEIERLKVAIFGEEVRAYASQVNAYTAQVEGYRAGVQAEVSKQDAFRSSVQAYTSQVDAASKQIDAQIGVLDAQLRTNQTLWEGYRTQVQTEGDRVRAISAKNEAVARMYQSEATAVGTFNEVLARQWSAASQVAINITEVSLAQARANAELFMTQRSMVLDAAKVGATVAAQLGAAALSANSVSTSFNNSRSISAGFSDSQSVAFSQSRSNSSSTSSSVNSSRSSSEVRSLSV
jgi:hypothetical protein